MHHVQTVHIFLCLEIRYNFAVPYAVAVRGAAGNCQRIETIVYFLILIIYIVEASRIVDAVLIRILLCERLGQVIIVLRAHNFRQLDSQVLHPVLTIYHRDSGIRNITRYTVSSAFGQRGITLYGTHQRIGDVGIILDNICNIPERAGLAHTDVVGGGHVRSAHNHQRIASGHHRIELGRCLTIG